MRAIHLVLVGICVQGAFGQSNFVIDSLQGDGSLSWTSDLTNATHYLIEWAPDAAGPRAGEQNLRALSAAACGSGTTRNLKG